MRARIRFEKTGCMRYIGHLDLMRFFQKAVKRAGLPIRYSEGFNPHQIMSFAAPLGVGITSEGEYMDIDLKTEVAPEAALSSLNNQMVEGLSIISFKYLPEKAEKCMTAVSAASYSVTYKDKDCDICYIANLNDLKELFFDKADAINIIKETKKGTREVDLKPVIYDFKLEYEGKVPVYKLLLSSGSVENIKPELVISHFHDFLELPFEKNCLEIHRIDMYTGEPGNFISLGEI